MNRQESKKIKFNDEFFSALLSALGTILSLVGVALIIIQAQLANKPWHVFSFLIYGWGLLCMFTASALYHGVNGSEKLNHLLHQFDYFAIFVMIAGTFTPFCLILLRNHTGWRVLGLMWLFAGLGITLKAFFPKMPKWLSTAFFIGMGWVAVFIAYPVYQILSWKGVLPLILGGIVYTAGAIIFYLEKPNPFPGKFGFHEIWHLFVLAGAGIHFYAIYYYLLPYG